MQNALRQRWCTATTTTIVRSHHLILATSVTISSRRHGDNRSVSSTTAATTTAASGVTSASTIRIDDWFESIVKPTDFYTRQAEATGLRSDDNGRRQSTRKHYFYTIDLQGRIFLEETLPKNIASSIKSKQFLDFFLRNIRRIRPDEKESLEAELSGAGDDYPYVSACGGELNFVRPADSVVVFHSLQDGDMDGGEQNASGGCIGGRDHGGGTAKELVFGGTLVQPLHLDRLAISRRSGRLYHPLVDPTKRGLVDSSGAEKGGSSGGNHRVARRLAGEYGLLRSSVAVGLSEHIDATDDDNDEDEGGGLSGLQVRDDATGWIYPIRWLPEVAEPGAWSLPVS